MLDYTCINLVNNANHKFNVCIVCVVWCVRRKSASGDELEAFEMEGEQQQSLQAEYRSIERVVTHSRHTNESGFPDYLVKWWGLPFAEATWEDGGLLHRFYAQDIDRSSVLYRRRGQTGVPFLKAQRFFVF